MTVVPLEIDDLDSIAALRPDNWADLSPVHEFYLGSTVCFPHKAVVGDEIVGIGTAIAFDGTGWLAHVIVRNEERNKGYGGAIVSFLMEYLARTRGCRSISLIATDMGYPVYRKRGFAEQAEYAVFEGGGGLPGGGVDGSIRGIPEDAYRDVLELDRLASGEDRRGVLVPHLEDGYAYIADGAVRGFYLPTLGEGLAIAADDDAGTALLRLKAGAGCASIALPSENAAGARYLREAGYRETKRLKRMVYGEGYSWNPRFVFSRIGGYLG